MRILGNILWWIPCCGFLNALVVFIIGGLLTITVIGAPLGLGLIQLGNFFLAPFSYALMPKSRLTPDHQENVLWRILGTILFLLYLPFGILLFIGSICQILAMCCTIIMIPMAIPYAKSLAALFNPVGKICVPVAVKELADRQQAEAAYKALQ